MKQVSEDINSISNYLSDIRDDILKEWEERTIETEGKPTEMATMSRNKFRDDIPEFLVGFCKSLKDEEVTLEDIGRKHGSQRWEFGLDLQQTMTEWNILHRVMINKLNMMHEEKGLGYEAIKKAQSILAAHIHEGILYSVKEFDRLKNSETEAQLLDLKRALEDPKGNMRDYNLRGTSHDLKGIMKNLQMGFFLLEDEQLDGRAGELIEQMESAADSLEKLLNNLLDLFRLETNQEELELSTFDAAELLRDLGKSMQPLARTEKVELTYDGEDTLKVTADASKLERIVRNLVLNALKYTGEGRVELKWSGLEDERWMLEISDTGPGLDATHAKTLTTQSDTSDTIENSPHPADVEVPREVETHGEGIGLLIVRHLSQLMNAIIKVETEAGEGTTFKVTFPREFPSDNE